MTQWMPIETAPKDGTRVLLATANEVTSGWWMPFGYEFGRNADPGGWTDGGVADWGMQHSSELFPSHWMPLPEPPKGEE